MVALGSVGSMPAVREGEREEARRFYLDWGYTSHKVAADWGDWGRTHLSERQDQNPKPPSSGSNRVDGGSFSI